MSDTERLEPAARTERPESYADAQVKLLHDCRWRRLPKVFVKNGIDQIEITTVEDDEMFRFDEERRTLRLNAESVPGKQAVEYCIREALVFRALRRAKGEPIDSRVEDIAADVTSGKLLRSRRTNKAFQKLASRVWEEGRVEF